MATHGHAVQCGCPPGSNRLISTQSTVMAAEEGSVTIAPDFAALAQAATHVWAKAISDGSYISEHSCDIPHQGLTGFMSPKTTPVEKTELVACNDLDMMEELAEYISNEMNTNIHHRSVLKMRELLSYDVAQETRKQMALPWYAQIGTTRPQAIGAANGAAAMALWTERVGQGMDWDHKHKIPKIIGGVWHKQGNYDYFYDIWSNIHYGYVGMAGGLSESVLSDGAGLEQIASDSLRKAGEKFTELLTLQTPEKPLPGPRRSGDVRGLRAWDDTPDRISIGIGIQLYKEQPNGGITAKMVMDKVLAISPTEWGEGVRAHKCTN